LFGCCSSNSVALIFGYVWILFYLFCRVCCLWCCSNCFDV